MAPVRVMLVAAVAAAAAAALTLTANAATSASTSAAVARAAAATITPKGYRPACPPYTTCRSDRDCRAGRYGKRRVCVVRRCTPSWCAVDPVTCAATGMCSKDCSFGVRGACADASVRPSPTPACPPYQVCGPGEPRCGRDRRCRLEACTSPACSVDPVTCALGVCLQQCLEGKGYCVPVGAPTPTPTRRPCPPYTICGRGKPACGDGRRCLFSTCTSSACQLDPVTCRIGGACTKDCQMGRGYCVDA